MPELLVSPYQWYSYLSRRRLRIVMYHSISDDPADPISVTPSSFRQEMALLAERGYRGISVGEALSSLDHGDSLARSVCLTFDDGFRDFYTEALPVLKQHGFGSTLYVVAGRVGKTSEWSSFRKDRPLLDWDELGAVVAGGCEIGSHTMSHPDLRGITDEALERELRDSRLLLEERLQVPVCSFAYPGGTFGARELTWVGKVGYSSAVIVGGRWGNGHETPRFRLKREKMQRRDSLIDFWHKVYGYYEPFFLAETLRERATEHG